MLTAFVFPGIKTKSLHSSRSRNVYFVNKSSEDGNMSLLRLIHIESEEEPISKKIKTLNKNYSFIFTPREKKKIVNCSSNIQTCYKIRIEASKNLNAGEKSEFIYQNSIFI